MSRQTWEMVASPALLNYMRQVSGTIDKLGNDLAEMEQFAEKFVQSAGARRFAVLAEDMRTIRRDWEQCALRIMMTAMVMSGYSGPVSSDASRVADIQEHGPAPLFPPGERYDSERS